METIKIRKTSGEKKNSFKFRADDLLFLKMYLALQDGKSVTYNSMKSTEFIENKFKNLLDANVRARLVKMNQIKLELK